MWYTVSTSSLLISFYLTPQVYMPPQHVITFLPSLFLFLPLFFPLSSHPQPVIRDGCTSLFLSVKREFFFTPDHHKVFAVQLLPHSLKHFEAAVTLRCYINELELMWADFSVHIISRVVCFTACESAVTLLFDAVMHLGCKPYLDSQRASCVCQYEVKTELWRHHSHETVSWPFQKLNTNRRMLAITFLSFLDVLRDRATGFALICVCCLLF